MNVGKSILTSFPKKAVKYVPGSFAMVDPKITVGRKITKRMETRNELSHRTYKAQHAWFEAAAPPQHQMAHQRRAHRFYNTETKLIWAAFDTPELIGMLLHDETIKGTKDMYADDFLEAAVHWVTESRYWRCLGISTPFYDATTLRACAWADNGLQVGTIVFSAAMRHAIMDLERAVKRKEMGLDPNYLWDKWGPVGFIDGSRSDFLPRFRHNPYVDPDGVEVTELDIAPYTTHEQLKERYSGLIFGSTEPYQGVFMAPSHGNLTVKDIPLEPLQELAFSGKPPDAELELDPIEMRTLLYLAADKELYSRATEAGCSTLAEVREKVVRPVMEENDEKIEFARLLHNTRHDPTLVRCFYEEMCGFSDFNYTPDKELTAATLCYLADLRRVLSSHEWARPLAESLTDFERVSCMGDTAFGVYRLIEDLILDKKRRRWVSRFSGDANEEQTLDYMLENFAKRPERAKNMNIMGGEFDREHEPIGRNVQRRVMDADRAQRLAELRKNKGRFFSKARDPFDKLHRKQFSRGFNAIK